MNLPAVLYRLYERRLERGLRPSELPGHVAVIIDGNRRWARTFGATAAEGHRQGGAKITEFLSWCEELRIPVATVWMLSTENLSRDRAELDELYRIIAGVVEDIGKRGWKVQLAGAADLLPCEVVQKIHAVQDRDIVSSPLTVNVAVGYGGRREITDAVRNLLLDADQAGLTPAELAATLTPESIAEHLYTKGQPDPDLIIRTSGEQRLSGFCCGSRCIPNSISAKHIGQVFAAWISCGPCAIMPTGSVASAPKTSLRGIATSRRRRHIV
ncbi:polyprenyl diphosphate synthase [Devriesea agamarum]